MTRRRYTEQQLRDAVEDPYVKTMADRCRALGLVPAGGNYESVFDDADAIEAHHDVSLAPLPRPTAAHLNDQAFLGAAARAHSYPDLCRQRGLRPHNNTYRRLRQRARQIARPQPTDWSPVLGQGEVPAPSRFRRRFRRAVPGNFSIAATVRDLGHPPNAATYERLPAAWSSTACHQPPQRRWLPHRPRSVPALVPLLTYGPQNRLPRLAKRLVRVEALGVRASRARPLQGEDLRLEWDHVNGDRRDNRLCNLRLLRPNCHAHTPTYRGRNI